MFAFIKQFFIITIKNFLYGQPVKGEVIGEGGVWYTRIPPQEALDGGYNEWQRKTVFYYKKLA
jgi:hypothetical protein